MKNNEMAINDFVSLKLPEKFIDEHPVAATVVYLVPVVIPVVWKGAKYIVDKVAEHQRFKVMVEHGLVTFDRVDVLDTISADEAIAS